VQSNLLRDGVKVRPLAGLEFRMNEFTVDANFKSTSARRDKFHTLDPGDVANCGRQTGGSRFVVSSRAVFDRDVCFHHAPSQLNPTWAIHPLNDFLSPWLQSAPGLRSPVNPRTGLTTLSSI